MSSLRERVVQLQQQQATQETLQNGLYDASSSGTIVGCVTDRAPGFPGEDSVTRERCRKGSECRKALLQPHEPGDSSKP